MFIRSYLLSLVILGFSATAHGEDVPSTIELMENSLPVGVRSVLKVRHLPAKSLSVYVENLDTGETILEWNAREPRNPASVM